MMSQGTGSESRGEIHRRRAAEHALHFHALRELAPEWAAAEPRRFPKELRPMPLDEAVEAFDVPHHSVDYRVAVAKLAHAAVVSGKPELHDHLAKALDRLPDRGALVQKSLEQLGPKQVYAGVQHALRQSVSDAGPCAYEAELPVLELNAQYGWARVSCEATVNRDIREFDGAGDPRQWKNIAPETFLESDALDGGEPPDFLLREVARWAPSGTVLSEYKNDLEIRYVAEAGRGMTLEYRLEKSISLEVPPLYTGDGGLSIDSGTARIYEPAGRPGFTTIAASKKLRHVFPNDDTVAIVLNYLSLPAMALLMDRFVVGGACP